jgi:tetratricopeptide (TPR) repeat protein
MKLSRSPNRLQLLFAALVISLAGPGSAPGQDKVTTKDGRTQEGKVTGVSAGTVQVQIGAGSVGVPLASISQVVMVTPADFEAGVAAYTAKDYAKSLALIRGVADKFKGLPTPWAQQATSLLGDIYVALNDPAKAEAAYREYQKLYPGQGSIQADLGMARVAVSRKDFAAAKEKVTPLIEQALKEKAGHPGGPPYDLAFYISGQIKEAEGDYPGALEDYLRASTLFGQDRTLIASAQEKADALRKAHKVTVP